jgi:hypothetical protein
MEALETLEALINSLKLCFRKENDVIAGGIIAALSLFLNDVTWHLTP